MRLAGVQAAGRQSEHRFVLHRYDSIDSTNTEAKRLADVGAPAGTVVLATEQTAGRGRQDRLWASPPGNLYISLLLRPDKPVGAVAQLGFVAAVAVAETVQEVAPSSYPRLKWPNDLLLDGRKLAGILLETATAATGGIAWLVMGMGINVAAAPIATAAALHSYVPTLTPDRLADVLLERLGQWIKLWSEDGFAPVREAWLRFGHRPGEGLRVRRPDGERIGTFHDLDQNGMLLLDTSSGPLAVSAGEIHLAA